MTEPLERSPELAWLEAIARTIREELGAEVEVCPGLRSPDHAEPLNRVFRAIARLFLRPLAAPQSDLGRLVSAALLRLSRARLAAGGLDESQIRTLLELEPGSPDDWLTFLILTPWKEVRFWLDPTGAEPD